MSRTATVPYSLLGVIRCGGHDAAGRGIALSCQKSKSSSRATNATGHLCVEPVLSLANTLARLGIVIEGMSQLLSNRDPKFLFLLFEDRIKYCLPYETVIL